MPNCDPNSLKSTQHADKLVTLLSLLQCTTCHTIGHDQTRSFSVPQGFWPKFDQLPRLGADSHGAGKIHGSVWAKLVQGSSAPLMDHMLLHLPSLGGLPVNRDNVLPHDVQGLGLLGAPGLTTRNKKLLETRIRITIEFFLKHGNFSRSAPYTDVE